MRMQTDDWSHDILQLSALDIMLYLYNRTTIHTSTPLEFADYICILPVITITYPHFTHGPDSAGQRKVMQPREGAWRWVICTSTFGCSLDLHV